MIHLLGFLKKKNAGPPEKEFLKQPKPLERNWFALKNFLEKWGMWIGAAFVFVIIVGFFWSHGAAKPKPQSVLAPEETRVLMTTVSMERAIDASSKSKPEKEIEPSKPLRLLPRAKRKLASSMGVFIFTKEERGTSQPRIEKAEKTKLGLSSGTKIPALLGERVFSFNVNAPVVAVLPKDFSTKDKVVIPKGSRFLGEATILKSIDRINVRFNLLVFPDGREIRVNALALSEDGAAGIKGKVEKHTDMKMAKAIGESVLSMGALFLGGRSEDPFSMQNQLELNVAQNLSDEARRNLRSVNVEKSVTVEASKPIYVFLLEAV